MAKIRGKCIYCGSAGLTHEHVWAKWLRQHIPALEDSYGVLVEEIMPGHVKRKIKKISGDPHSRRIRKVCGACNNGWMSLLQDDAKPILGSMLEGGRISLTPETNAILSAWFTMAVFIVDSDPLTYVATSQTERNAFRISRKCPEHWKIWIGTYLDETSNSLFTKILFKIRMENDAGFDSDSGTGYNTQTMTFFVGPVFFYAMSSSIHAGRGFIIRWHWPDPIDQKLAQIWPASSASFQWPLARTLNGFETKFIGDSLLIWLTAKAQIEDR